MANYFSFDERQLEENSGKKDAERTVHQMAVISFKNQPNMTIAEGSAVFRSEPIMPTEFGIGTIGDFMRSAEFWRETEEIGQLKMQHSN